MLHSNVSRQVAFPHWLRAMRTAGHHPSCSTSTILASFLIISSLIIAFFICSIALVILHTVLCGHHHSSSRSSALTGVLVHLLLLSSRLRFDWNILLDLVILFRCLLCCDRRSRGRRRRRGAWAFYRRRAGRGVGRRCV